MIDEFGPNPFQPRAGLPPPHLAGRLEQLENFGRGLDEPGSLERVTQFTGGRGIGKTVMIDEVRAIAQQRGWRVIAETADRGFVDRLANVQLPDLMGDLAVRDRTLKLKGANALGFGVEWETGDRFPVASDLRSGIARATELIERKDGAGLLITLDELHRGEPEEIARFGSALQHCVREGRPIALASAGLPMITDDVLVQDPTVQMLRHGDRVELRMLSRAEVGDAIAVPIEDAGRRITPGALDVAVEAVRGHPALTQHVGTQLWRSDGPVIGLDAAEHAIRHGTGPLWSAVLDRALGDLDRGDRAFLVGMSADDGPARLGDVADRLGIGPDDAGRVRARLLSAGMIHDRGGDRLVFTMPYLRDHLRSFGPRLSTFTARQLRVRTSELSSPGLDL